MRVTFLTHYYPPEVGAPQARISGLARRLAERGAEVTVHTGFPHYPDGRIRGPYSNRPYLVESDGPVRVVRTAVYATPNRGFARRLADHAAFAASSVAAAPVTGGADVVVAESPPLFTAAAGVGYARVKRAPLVLNVADIWPASAVELGALRDPRAIRAATWLEQACYRVAARIVAPAEGQVARLSALGSAAGKVAHIGPSVDVDAFRPSPRTPGDALQVLYAGTLGMAQGLETLVAAAGIAGAGTVQVVIAGDGAESDLLRRRVADDGLSNVRLVGSVPHEYIAQLYADNDAAVVLLRDRPLFADVLPTKILESMAAGRALVLAARGESARLVEECGAGVVVPPEDPQALARAFEELARAPDRLEDLAAAGRRCAVERFSRERAGGAWWDLLREVA